MNKERFTEIEVEHDILCYKASGWDNELQKERELFVSYADIVNFAADQYFDGDKSTAASWLKNIDWLSMKDEIVLLFKEKMGADDKHKMDSGEVGDKKDGKRL